MDAHYATATISHQSPTILGDGMNHKCLDVVLYIWDQAARIKDLRGEPLTPGVLRLHQRLADIHEVFKRPDYTEHSFGDSLALPYFDIETVIQSLDLQLENFEAALSDGHMPTSAYLQTRRNQQAVLETRQHFELQRMATLN